MFNIFPASLRGDVNNRREGRKANLYASIKKCSGEEFINKCIIYKEIILSK